MDSRYRLTVQWSVPPIWLAIARSEEVTDHFDSLEIAGTGAAPMSAELAKEAARKLGKGRILIVTQLYGATETTGSITGIAWDATDETVKSSTPMHVPSLWLTSSRPRPVRPSQMSAAASSTTTTKRLKRVNQGSCWSQGHSYAKVDTLIFFRYTSSR